MKWQRLYSMLVQAKCILNFLKKNKSFSFQDAFGTKEPLTRTDLLTEQTWQLNASTTSTLENQNGYILCTDSYYAIQLDVHSLIAST